MCVQRVNLGHAISDVRSTITAYVGVYGKACDERCWARPRSEMLKGVR